MLNLFLKIPSGTFTLLRLISNLTESDGRYVHILELNSDNPYSYLTFKSNLKFLFKKIIRKKY